MSHAYKNETMLADNVMQCLNPVEVPYAGLTSVLYLIPSSLHHITSRLHPSTPPHAYTTVRLSADVKFQNWSCIMLVSECGEGDDSPTVPC